MPALQATGRQREPGSFPSGNKSSRKVAGINTQGIQELDVYQAASLPRPPEPPSPDVQ